MLPARTLPLTPSLLWNALAVRLGIPLYGCDPALQYLGSKSGSRKIMREAGMVIPDGIEDIADEDTLAAALAALKSGNPALRRAVVKLNEGFSGDGNAIFRFDDAPAGVALEPWVKSRLSALAFEAGGMNWETYRAKLRQMGGVVEIFVEGDEKSSPSAQYRIDAGGAIEAVSTHDQVLGGPSGQVFLGSHFPADAAYRLGIQTEGLKVAEVLRQRGVLGRFGVDFVCVRSPEGWRSYAIEINLRKGGTTHPFMMLQFLTGGAYDPATGQLYTQAGQPRFYYASDNLESPLYKGLTPGDVVDIAVLHRLHYDATTHTGVVFHLIGAVSEFGKLGVVCVGCSPEQAQEWYQRTVDILNQEQG